MYAEIYPMTNFNRSPEFVNKLRRVASEGVERNIKDLKVMLVDAETFITILPLQLTRMVAMKKLFKQRL